MLRELNLKGLAQGTCQSRYQGARSDDTEFDGIQKALPRSFTTDLFCAGFGSGGTCPGDSGGPILAVDEFKLQRTYIRGIVHGSGVACDGSRYPPFFVRVNSYPILQWIYDNTFPGQLDIQKPKISDISKCLVVNSTSQPVKSNLNKKLDPKQKTIQAFNIQKN